MGPRFHYYILIKKEGLYFFAPRDLMSLHKYSPSFYNCRYEGVPSIYYIYR